MTTEMSKEVSMLNVLLNSHRKSPEGHVLLTPVEAREMLLDVLYELYKEHVNASPTPGEKTDSRIEALRRIAGGRLDTDTFDYTATEAGISQERQESESILKAEQKSTNKIIFPQGQRPII